MDESGIQINPQAVKTSPHDDNTAAGLRVDDRLQTQPFQANADTANCQAAVEEERAVLFQALMRRDVELAKTKAALRLSEQEQMRLKAGLQDRFDEIAYLTGRLMKEEKGKETAVWRFLLLKTHMANLLSRIYRKVTRLMR